MDAQALPLPIAALAAATRKRGLLDGPNLDRLIKRLRRDGVSDLAALRRWLVEGDINPKVGAALSALLPRHDDRQLGGCHILARLAEGGMGRVDLVAHEGHLRVLKTLPQDRAGRTNPIRRFRREATITATLDHPHIVRCHGQGEERGQLYLILDFVAGGDVQQLISRSGRLDEGDALTIVRHMALALAYAHERQLIHRDIKPANGFIDEGGRVLVADFGLARSTSDETSLLTAPGGAVGTPCYMAPEQIRGEDLDRACDAYALGCVLHACLIGEPPWSGSLQEVIRGHLDGPIPDLRSLRADCSLTTLDLHRSLLTKDRGRRLADAGEIIAACDRGLADLGLAVDRLLTQPSVARSTRTVGETVSAAAHSAAETLTTRDDAKAAVETAQIERPDAIFVGDLAHALVARRLDLTRGGEPFLVLIAADSCTLGRAQDADVPLSAVDHGVGRRHARIVVADDGSAAIEDLNSANGSWLDEAWMAPGRLLPITPGAHALRLAGDTCLRLTAHPQRTPTIPALTGAPPGRDHCAGLERDADLDALIISGEGLDRPAALLIRRLVLGEDEDLPAIHEGQVVEIARYRGAWILRTRPAPWEPLCPETLQRIGLGLAED